ncbi:MAG TPA: hypothetical protein VK806_13010, partial [Bacteroidia bacterium]|nr:hypothetical protein [Bacteroidia bacterium]
MKNPRTSDDKYCTFIDVLGYRNIVLSDTRTKEDKIKILSSIYMNLFSSISIQVKHIRELNPSIDIFIKSFSDSVYLESNEPYPILFALHYIYNVAFGYNMNFSPDEHYTPLIRSGTVRDWTLRIMDIGALTAQAPGVI